MLLIGRRRVFGDGATAHVRGEGSRVVRTVPLQPPPRLADQAVDRRPGDEVGKGRVLKLADGGIGNGHGHSGMRVRERRDRPGLRNVPGDSVVASVEP